MGCSKPAIRRSVVVLPQPDGPSSEKNSPWLTDRSSASTAVNVAELLRDLLELDRGGHSLLPVRTAMLLSCRPSSRGSATARTIRSPDTTIITVPTALIVGEMPKRRAE